MKKLSLALILLFFCIPGLANSTNESKKVDELPDTCCEDEEARLDNLAVQLQMDPEAKIYIIFYGARSFKSCGQSKTHLPRRGEAEARAARLKPYLVERRSIDPNRIVVVNGGYRETWIAELWLVPQDATPPKPTPSLELKDIKFGSGKIKKGEFVCQV